MMERALLHDRERSMFYYMNYKWERSDSLIALSSLIYRAETIAHHGNAFYLANFYLDGCRT